MKRFFRACMALMSAFALMLVVPAASADEVLTADETAVSSTPDSKVSSGVEAPEEIGRASCRERV